MRASRTLLAAAALVSLAACGSQSPELLAPNDPSRNGSWIGSGNSVQMDSTDASFGTGWIGTGNSVQTDPTAPSRGAGLMGSGN